MNALIAKIFSTVGTQILKSNSITITQSYKTWTEAAWYTYNILLGRKGSKSYNTSSMNNK